MVEEITVSPCHPVTLSNIHLIDLPQALEFVLKCCTGYRLPEPTRWAHKFAAGEKLPVEGGDQKSLL